MPAGGRRARARPSHRAARRFPAGSGDCDRGRESARDAPAPRRWECRLPRGPAVPRRWPREGTHPWRAFCLISTRHDFSNCFSRRAENMLHMALVFLVIGLVAALLGFTTIAGASIAIA